MLTFKGEGRRLQWTNPDTVALASGAVAVLAKGIGIAVATIAASAIGTIEVQGEHELAANSTDTWSLGEQLYWDAANDELTSTAGASNKAGMASADKEAAAVLASVIVNRNVA